MIVGERPGFTTRVLDRAVAWRWKLPKATHRFRIERDLAIPMRDGITLLADHYVPVDTEGRGTILIRTPYGRGLPINTDARLFAGQGYHVVAQSCRGSFGSGGQFTPMAADMDDGQDTMAWLSKQPWFDGRLATYGASGVGWTQWALLVDPPPELRAAVIIAAPHDATELGLGTGAFRLHDLLTWSRVIVNQERFGLLGTMWIFAQAARLNARTVAALPLADAADIALDTGRRGSASGCVRQTSATRFGSPTTPAPHWERCRCRSGWSSAGRTCSSPKPCASTTCCTNVDSTSHSPWGHGYTSR